MVLGILCIVSLVALNFAVFTYYTDINNKNNQIQTLNDRVVELQTQLANGTKAKLVEIGMQYIDNRTNLSAPFLQVTGYVCNVGTSASSNGVLHVTATQANSAGIDDSANIESIEAGAFIKIDIKFPYDGTPLLEYSSNLEWGA
jgi:hypothetical protein